MRDPNRIEPMIKLLCEVWTKVPDLRLGQILVNAIRPNEPVPAVFYVEDDKVLEGLKAFADFAGEENRTGAE